MIKKNVLNSPRLSELKRRRRRAFLNKALLYLLALAAMFSLLAYLSRLPGINIKTIETEGNSIVDTEAINGVAERELAGKYLWLFPKTNALFYPKNKIKNSLAREFGRLGEINLTVKNNRSLLIAVTEREPLYTWCGANPPAGAEEIQACYFLDREGYVFDEAPYFSGEVYFRFYGSPGVNLENPAGSYFAPEYFKNLVSFKQNLEVLKLEPTGLHLKTDGDADLFLSGAKNQKPKILIRADADMENLAENLSAALETEPLKTRMAKEYFKLEYLDLRFSNKVYSKFR